LEALKVIAWIRHDPHEHDYIFTNTEAARRQHQVILLKYINDRQPVNTTIRAGVYANLLIEVAMIAIAENPSLADDTISRGRV
jgi:hypothetical protein